MLTPFSEANKIKITLIPIEHWIVKNQPEQENEYYTGWWDSMEFVRRLSEDFSSFHFDVIDTFVMDTPPPTSNSNYGF